MLGVADQSEGDVEEGNVVTHCTLIFEGQTDKLSSCDTRSSQSMFSMSLI